jgi:hypothetical protein
MFPYADLEGNKNQEKGFREICGSLFFYAYNSPWFSFTASASFLWALTALL